VIQPQDAIDWTRWLFYLLAGVPFIVWLFFTRNRVLRLLAVVCFGMFLQDSIVGRRYTAVGASVAPSLMLAYIALLAEVLSQRRMPQLGAYLPLWLAFLFFAAVGIPAGSVGTGLWTLNIMQFQLAYFEGIVFFVYGVVALRQNDETMRFLRHLILVGLGVGLVHMFSLGTGFRFRNSIVENEGEGGVFYAGVLDNINSLGSLYVMIIPVALAILVGQRQSRAWRIVTLTALIGMAGSLVLSASRGGIIFTMMMCFVALAAGRLGVARAVAASTVAGLATVVGYFVTVALLPDAWRIVTANVAEEGLATNRFYLFGRYTMMLFENPFGIGLSVANFGLMLSRYGIPGVVSAHNIYLDIGLQTGLPGLLLFLSICGLVLLQNRRAFRLARDRQQRDTLLLLFLPVLGFLAVGFFEPIYTISTKLNNLFWLLCGLSVGESARVFAAHRAERQREAYGAAPGDLAPTGGHAQHA
jgi:O-antigen ligase